MQYSGAYGSNPVQTFVPEYSAFIKTDLSNNRIDSKTRLNSFYSYLKNHVYNFVSALKTAPLAIQNTFVQNVGTPTFQNGLLYIPIRYTNGEMAVLQLQLQSHGIALRNLTKPKQAILLPFNDPYDSISKLFQSVIYGGKTLQRELNRFSGRRTVFGQRGNVW